MDSLKVLKQEIDAFAEERDWVRYHTPANLAKSISIEAAELLECFQWEEENYDLQAVKEELADVLNYALRMASVMGLDVKEIIEEKMVKNAAKYPVEKARGKATKYDKL